MSKLDEVYFLVQNGKNVFYSPPATNRLQCWANGAQWDAIEGGSHGYVNSTYVMKWRKSMKTAGWKCVKLELRVPQDD